jgi:hypothetical protein
MKKIKPQYGKVVAPAVNPADAKDRETQSEVSDLQQRQQSPKGGADEKIGTENNETAKTAEPKTGDGNTKAVSRLTSEPNPFLQTKEVFAKARLTKIGYRMRSDYVEILDIIKKIKKGGYTLEAVLDDALTYYFENSEDGREAIKKAEIFYS